MTEEHRLALALEELGYAAETVNRLRRDRDLLLATLKECVDFINEGPIMDNSRAILLEHISDAIARTRLP